MAQKFKMLKKILKWSLLSFVALILILVVIISLQPADFRIERSITISAPPAAIFPHINDLHAFADWSPWSKLDPAMTSTYDGPATGPGAHYTWSGNNTVGEGAMTITASHPSDQVTIKLEFIKPFPATNEALFTLTPAAHQTTITWTMTGKKNFMAKGFGLFVNVDKLVGADFEKGLSQLKTLVESPKPTPATEAH